MDKDFEDRDENELIKGDPNLMPKPRNREFAWFEKHLEEITEQDLRAALESEDNSAEDFLILTKMLCGKKGMTNNEGKRYFVRRKEDKA